MSKKPQQQSKNRMNEYQQQQDYGQFENRNNKMNKDDYEIYEKEDYSQYIQKNGQDNQYYYETNDFQDQQQQNDQQKNDESQDDQFEEVPHIQKILAKKNNHNINHDHKVKNNQLNQGKQKQENDQEEQDDDEDQQYENQSDEENEEQLQQIEDGGGDHYYDDNEEEQLQQQDLDKQYDNEDEEQYEQNNKQAKGILKKVNQKQSSITTKDSQQSSKIIQKSNQLLQQNGSEYNDNEEEDDSEQQNQQQSTKSRLSSNNNNNYLKQTKSFQTKASLKQEEKSLSKLSEPFDNIYNTKKYPLGIVDDPELEKERKNLWKQFGRDCPAGRELFALYKCHQPPKMNYPKPKQKTAEELLPLQKEIKPCPQKTQISYPPLSYKIPKQRFHKVDFIPKRKPESEIRKELEEIQKNPYIPVNTGKNRKDLIDKLQQKFKYMRGGLPKGAELPMIDENKMIYNEEMIKTQAQKRIGMKNKVFTGQYEDRNETKTVISDDPVQECNELFNQIMQEIEERQEYLDSIQHLKEPALKTKIKKEIIERVAELQKVTELKQKYA